MATEKDIASLPNDAKDFLLRQGHSLNPWVWHNSYQYPEDAARFAPERNHHRLYVLKTNTGFQLLTQHQLNKKGVVYVLHRREGSSGPSPVAPRVEIRKATPQLAHLLESPPIIPGVDAEQPLRYFAKLRFTYANSAGVIAPYSIASDVANFHGELTAGDTRQHALTEPTQLTYRVGEALDEPQWQSNVELLASQLQALSEQVLAEKTTQQLPARVQSLSLINTGVLQASTALLPTALYGEGYPLQPLFKRVQSVWQQQHHRPDQFTQAVRTECLANEPEANVHVANTFGLNPQAFTLDKLALAYHDFIYLLNEPKVLEPLLHAAQLLEATEPKSWQWECALAALCSYQAPASAQTAISNYSPWYSELRELGNTLHQLAQALRQQDKHWTTQAPASHVVEAVINVPELTQEWPKAGEPNWVELNYNDSDQPFPAGTQLSYWLYDDNDELLYEGEDLTPGTPQRFLLPNDVNEVSYRFAMLPQKAGVLADELQFKTLFHSFGQPIVHLYDVGPLMEWEKGLSFRSITNKGSAAVLRPYQVDLLQRALQAIDLPTDERGVVVPNSYVLLADAHQGIDAIKTAISQQLGDAIADEDWQLIDTQLERTQPSEPIILDLTWLYADLLFRAAAERFDDEAVQACIERIASLEELKANLPRDPWWLRYNLFSVSNATRSALMLSKRELESRLDALYKQQKQANLIPYRHVNRELNDWVNGLLFTMATFFIPIELWAIKSGSALLQLIRHKYFLGGAAFGVGMYAGDAEAGRFTKPDIISIKAPVRAIAAKTLLDDALKYGLQYKAVNAPTKLSLDGGLGTTRTQHVGRIPQQALPAAPDGHHWFRHSDGQYNTKRNPGYDGPRKEYDASQRRYFDSKKHETTPGSSRFKAEFAEQAAYDYMEAQGHRAVPGFRRPTYGQHGIDGLFFNASPPPTYIVMEAKYHKSSYGNTTDGKQMSDLWIVNRIENQAPVEVFLAIIKGDYSKIGARYRPDLERIVLEEIKW